MFKRCLSAFMLLVFLCTSIPGYASNGKYRKHYTKRNEVDGSMYTERDGLAQKLNSIFDGNTSLYTDSGLKKAYRTPIGTRTVTYDDYLYTGKKGSTNSGSTCWIYANGVYYTLFGEVTGNGRAGSNSVMLSNCSGQQVTYTNFQKWGVRNEPGALLRIGGHSIILLKYDESRIYYLEGNADDKGLIRVTVESWNNFYYSGSSWKVKYIIQPKDSYFKKLYPTYLEQCKSYNASGYISISSATTVKSLPCSRSTNSKSTDVYSAKKNERYKVTGLYKNSAGNYWYQIGGQVNANNNLSAAIFGYVYAGDAMPEMYGWTGYHSLDGKTASNSFFK